MYRSGDVVLRRCSARPFTHSTRPLIHKNNHRTTYVVAQSLSSVKASAAKRKHRVVFLGTPQVAAGVLQDLLSASQQHDSNFEISLVVSQPGKPKGRGNRGMAVPSPVEALARDLLPADNILCPVRAKEEDFLRRLEELEPDLAITAAYGNMLPQRFLDIPQYGTLNVHPSLLPKYRGAAPVQRALEDGVTETGVSVAYTVLACDAGPVLAQRRVPVDPDVTAPELLQQLFRLGGQLLVEKLPDVFAGRGTQMAVSQDETQVVHAAKLTREEAHLDFSSAPAAVLHNRVRAFAGWPGTSATFLVQDEYTGASEPMLLKIIKTRWTASPTASSSATTSASSGAEVDSRGAEVDSRGAEVDSRGAEVDSRGAEVDSRGAEVDSRGAEVDSRGAEGGAAAAVLWLGEVMLVPCLGGTLLEVLQVQPPTKKVMSVQDFKNGLRGKRLLLPLPLPRPGL
ncbi:hypothetical protein VaNZ11_006151 [Volvox africanus]|uniref:Methionyl-tRNA formyltransferase, mitochondrial n=1 Tax=Volvox africanus TaxID=51714 RepID=A0ABQ5S034_9CHLO|nr:hypothetical protein VaNZ11_006151 [Volvox africanus]